MLDVTVRVTKSPTHLEQIHHIGILNRGQAGPGSGFYLYDVYVDGKPLDYKITHFRADGALALLRLALGHLEQQERNKCDDLL